MAIVGRFSPIRIPKYPRHGGTPRVFAFLAALSLLGSITFYSAIPAGSTGVEVPISWRPAAASSQIVVMRSKHPPEICPNCRAEVPRQAQACPTCGADEDTGWSESVTSSGADLPDASFDYDDFVRREFGAQRNLPRGIGWFWWMVAVVLVVLMAGWLLRLW